MGSISLAAPLEETSLVQHLCNISLSGSVWICHSHKQLLFCVSVSADLWHRWLLVVLGDWATEGPISCWKTVAMRARQWTSENLLGISALREVQGRPPSSMYPVSSQNCQEISTTNKRIPGIPGIPHTRPCQVQNSYAGLHVA